MQWLWKLSYFVFFVKCSVISCACLFLYYNGKITNPCLGNSCSPCGVRPVWVHMRISHKTVHHTSFQCCTDKRYFLLRSSCLSSSQPCLELGLFIFAELLEFRAQFFPPSALLDLVWNQVWNHRNKKDCTSFKVYERKHSTTWLTSIAALFRFHRTKK